eukprot:Em0012g597a
MQTTAGLVRTSLDCGSKVLPKLYILFQSQGNALERLIAKQGVDLTEEDSSDIERVVDGAYKAFSPESLDDLEGVLVPPEIRTETAMHVYLLEKHLQCPWVEDAGEDA